MRLRIKSVVRKNLYVSLFHHPLISVLDHTEEAQSQSWNYNSEVRDQGVQNRNRLGNLVGQRLSS